MPYKDKEKQKEYFKNYYSKNREKKLKARKDRYDRTPYDARLSKNSSLKHKYNIISHSLLSILLFLFYN